MRIKSPDWIDVHETLPGDNMRCYVLCAKELPRETLYFIREGINFFPDFRPYHWLVRGALAPVPAFCTYDQYEEEYEILDNVVAWLPDDTTFALEEDTK
jgi:hypothetical protein